MWFVVTSDKFTRKDQNGDLEMIPLYKWGWLGVAKHAVAVSMYVASLRLHRIWKDVVAEQDDIRNQFRQLYKDYIYDPKKQGKHGLQGNETIGEALQKRWAAITGFFAESEDPTRQGIEMSLSSSNFFFQIFLNKEEFVLLGINSCSPRCASKSCSSIV